MNRRDFLTGGAAGLVIGGVGGYIAAGTKEAKIVEKIVEKKVEAPAVVKGVKELKMVSTWPRDFPGLGTGAQRLAQRITDMTEGAIKVEYFAAGERVGAFDSFDEVASGNAEAYHAADYYWKGKHPGFAYFTGVPFGLTYTEMNSWIRFGGGQELWDELAAEFGLKCVMAGNTGVQMGGWFRKEIKTVADLQGLKMRIGGIAGQVLAKVGVVPQQLAGGDIYPSLEKGTIDAAEWVGPYDDEKLGFNKVAKYYYYPGFWEGGPTVHAFTNLEKFNALPKNYQAILTNAAAHVNGWMPARYDMQNPGALKRLVASGTQLRPFTNEVLDACLKATNELWAEISGKNADFKKAIDAMQAYRSDQYLWWQVAEYTNDSFMIRSRTRG